MFKVETDHQYCTDLTGVSDADYIIIFDAEDKPLMIFPRCGRDRDFLHDYVSLCLRFFDTNVYCSADSKTNPFAGDYKKLAGLDRRDRLEKKTTLICDFFDAQNIKKRKPSAKSPLPSMEHSKVS